MLSVLLCAIKDKGRRELFMASFTNKPSVFTYSVDMDFAASFMEIDSLSALLTPFTQRLRRDGQVQQQQQQRGILGRMLLTCYSAAAGVNAVTTVLSLYAVRSVWSCERARGCGGMTPPTCSRRCGPVTSTPC